MFEKALCELMDAMISAGISEWRTYELVGSLLDTIMSGEEMRKRIECGKYEKFWA